VIGTTITTGSSRTSHSSWIIGCISTVFLKEDI